MWGYFDAGATGAVIVADTPVGPAVTEALGPATVIVGTVVPAGGGDTTIPFTALQALATSVAALPVTVTGVPSAF